MFRQDILEWDSLSCVQLCNFVDYGPPDSFVHGIFQVRILEWDFSWPRDRTQVSWTAGQFFTIWTTREAQYILSVQQIFFLCCMICGILFPQPEIELSLPAVGAQSQPQKSPPSFLNKTFHIKTISFHIKNIQYLPYKEWYPHHHHPAWVTHIIPPWLHPVASPAWGISTWFCFLASCFPWVLLSIHVTFLPRSCDLLFLLKWRLRSTCVCEWSILSHSCVYSTYKHTTVVSLPLLPYNLWFLPSEAALYILYIFWWSEAGFPRRIKVWIMLILKGWCPHCFPDLLHLFSLPEAGGWQFFMLPNWWVEISCGFSCVFLMTNEMEQHPTSR